MGELQLEYCYIDSPVGSLLLAGKNEVLYLVSFSSGKGVKKPLEGWIEKTTVFAQAKLELAEYFDGKRTQFTVPIKIDGTQFQTEVWQELAKIPYGTTTSYGEMAKNIGRPKASRAVGAANGANRLPIILPCHRVIGANKSLTGFAGGLPVKEFLLALEQKVAPQSGHQHQLL